MGEILPIFLVAGGFVGTIGLIAWLTRKNKGGDEDSDSGTFLASTTSGSIDDDSSSSSSDSGSSSSDSGSSDSGSSSSC